jgi:hypothetical protein
MSTNSQDVKFDMMQAAMMDEYADYENACSEDDEPCMTFGEFFARKEQAEEASEASTLPAPAENDGNDDLCF